MKKNIWLAAGITGMLLGTPPSDAKAAVSINISSESRPSFIINSPPSFIYLRTQGFSVSVGSPYDIVYYGDMYYLYHNGYWYRSYYYRGPWTIILSTKLPYQIRRHRWEDIRRYRDVEFRRPDGRNNQYQRNDDIKRRALDQRGDANNRKVQLQQQNALENRMIQNRQNNRPQQQQNQNQQIQAPQQQKNQRPQSEAPKPRPVQNQQRVAPEQQQNQRSQSEAPKPRPAQNQQNRAPKQQQNQRPQSEAPKQRPVQNQQHVAPEQRQIKANQGAPGNKQGSDQPNKDNRGKKND
jgi:hypothetical protein